MGRSGAVGEDLSECEAVGWIGHGDVEVGFGEEGRGEPRTLLKGRVRLRKFGGDSYLWFGSGVCCFETLHGCTEVRKKLFTR